MKPLAKYASYDNHDNVSMYSYMSVKTPERVKELSKTILLFKILSDPTRFTILSMLTDAPEGLCVYEIADGAGISHSAASHQLSKLEAHNIVESFREGQTVCYELKNSALTRSIIHIMSIIQ